MEKKKLISKIKKIAIENNLVGHGEAVLLWLEDLLLLIEKEKQKVREDIYIKMWSGESTLKITKGKKENNLIK